MNKGYILYSDFVALIEKHKNIDTGGILVYFHIQNYKFVPKKYSSNLIKIPNFFFTFSIRSPFQYFVPASSDLTRFHLSGFRIL
jgi:hypothetical protein